MEFKSRVEMLRLERGNLEELSSEERIARAYETLVSYFHELLHPLVGKAEIEDYTAAIQETWDSLTPDEQAELQSRMEPILTEFFQKLAQRGEFSVRREIYLEEMRGVPANEIIARHGGIEQMERLIGSEEVERLKKEAEKEE